MWVSRSICEMVDDLRHSNSPQTGLCQQPKFALRKVISCLVRTDAVMILHNEEQGHIRGCPSRVLVGRDSKKLAGNVWYFGVKLVNVGWAVGCTGSRGV